MFIKAAITGGAVLAVLALAGFIATRFYSNAELFSALVPHDGGTRQLLRDAAYGSGARRMLDVYAPDGAGKTPPIAIFFYGGAWNSGTKNGYGFAGAALAARGFVTVVPDYRLHPEGLYPGFLEDGAAAIAWARNNADRIGGDGNRIVLIGHSAGAYNAAMLALDERWLAQAGVPRSAIRAFAGLAGPYNFLPLDDPATIRTFKHVDDLPGTQPVNFVTANSPPAFLATGDADTTVLPRHTRQLGEKLRAADVPAQTKNYTGIGHVGLMTALSLPLRGRAPVLMQMTDFLHLHAGEEAK